MESQPNYFYKDLFIYLRSVFAFLTEIQGKLQLKTMQYEQYNAYHQQLPCGNCKQNKNTLHEEYSAHPYIDFHVYMERG